MSVSYRVERMALLLLRPSDMNPLTLLILDLSFDLGRRDVLTALDSAVDLG